MTDFSRISGLASGFDTESIIQDLMKVHRMPVDRLKQERQILEWQREDYRAINRSLLAFRTNYSFNMKLQSTFLVKSVTSTDENVVTAAAPSTAQNASYYVSATALASAAYNSSSESISLNAGDKIDADSALWEQMDKFKSWQTASASGESITVTSETAGTEFILANGCIESVNSITVNSVSYSIYFSQAEFDAAHGTQKVLVDKLTGQLTFAEHITEGSVIEADYSYYESTFSITTYDQEGNENYQDFTIDFAQDSLNDVLASISADQSLGITAYYDETSDKVSIATTRTGDNNTGGAEILVGTTGFLADTLKIDEAMEEGGTDAVLTVNGLNLTRKSNDFTLNNVNFCLKGTGSATVTVEHNTDEVVNAVTEFINQYNTVLQQINDKLTEEYYSDYPPLTDEQREQLTDNQIELWEEKARSGLLRNDALLRKAAYDLRSCMSSRVSGLGTYDSLAAVGITTLNYQENGLLHIDEDTLRSAVENDPEAVMSLFTTDGETSASDGIGRRVYDSLTDILDLLTQKAGSPDSLLYDNSYTSRSIREIDSQIDKMEERLENLEDRYWRQFTAMEQAISRMNAQSSWLAQMFMNTQA